MAAPASSGQLTKATLWTVVDFVFGQGLNIAVIIVLARVLTPNEFGTVALLAIFLGLANALVEGGFGQALVQRQDITEEDKSTVFWLSLVSGVILTGCLLAIAPHIASFFDLPILLPIANIMSLGVLFGGFASVHRALLTKELAFQKLTFTRIASSIVSGGAAIWLALAGYGVFALAWQATLAALMTTLMLWFLADWRPTRVFRLSSVRRLFRFGGYMLASTILETIYSRAYTLLIGTFSGTVQLGYFARAESTARIVSGVIIHPISQVAFPAFSQMNKDIPAMAAAMRSAIQASMLFNTTAMLGLIGVAGPFVRGIFGDQWAPAIPLLQVLCVGGILMPLHALNLRAMMALGRSDLFFRLEVVKKLIGIAILLAASFWGSLGIAWGIVLAGFVSFFINTWYAQRILGYGAVAQMIDILPSVGVAVLVALAAQLTVASMEQDSQIAVLMVSVGVGALVFVVAVLLLRASWSLVLPPILRR